METRRDIAYDKSIPFLEYLLALPSFEFQWDQEKQKIYGMYDGQPWSFRMPLPFPLPLTDTMPFPSYLEMVPSSPVPHFLILIQAGHSAMAYFEDGEMVHHKVIKKYMVRGNGRAQVNYLQSRGKSKAGSRIRLANTISFFEDINEKLREWDKADTVERILISCPIQLQPLWFQSRIRPPFDKDDPRMIKVPLDVQRPDLEELENVHKTILRGRWEGPAEIVDAFFSSL
jgi:hypothetical protein